MLGSDRTGTTADPPHKRELRKRDGVDPPSLMAKAAPPRPCPASLDMRVLHHNHQPSPPPPYRQWPALPQVRHSRGMPGWPHMRCAIREH